jgi:hypothetical protein
MIPNMQVTQLQRPTQRDNERGVQRRLRAQRAFLCRFVRDAVFALEDRGRERLGRDTAGERRVVVDVEFEEVEEFVGYEVDGAVYVFFHAEVEFEGPARFVADWERDVLELAGRVDDLRGVRIMREVGMRWLRQRRTCSPVSLGYGLAVGFIATD